MSFGKRIVELRKQNNMTQTDLGNQLNISAQAISKWERDLAEPDLATLKKMAEIFNMSVDEMLYIKKDEPANLEDELKDEEDSDKENVTQNNVNNYYIVNNINEESNNSKQSQSDVIDNLDKVLSLKAENLSCEKCGSSDVYIIDDQTAQCKHCGAVIDRKKVVFNKVVNNNYYDTNERSDSGDNIYYIRPKIDKNEFFRKALASISLDNNTPVDVLSKSTFSDVKIERLEFVQLKAQYSGNVTASVGYDRKEKYEDYEKYYDVQLGRECTRKVIKERVVTDWQPYSATYSSIENSVALVDEEKEDESITIKGLKGEKIYCNYAKLFEDTFKNDDYVPFDDAGIDFEIKIIGERTAKEVIGEGAFKAHQKIKIPGDHVRDDNHTTQYHVLEQNVFIIDMYILKYSYNGKTYYVKSLSNTYYPIYTNPSDEANQEKDIDNLSSSYSSMSIFFSLVSIVLAFLNFAMKTDFSMVLIVVSAVLSIMFYVLYKKQRKKIQRRYLNDRKQRKIALLNSYLKSKNLKTTTSDELSKI